MMCCVRVKLSAVPTSYSHPQFFCVSVRREMMPEILKIDTAAKNKRAFLASHCMIGIRVRRTAGQAPQLTGVSRGKS